MVVGPRDFVATSADWGVGKAAPIFFTTLASPSSGMEPGEIAYVGDRVDNDIVPAADAGMFTVHLRRGPWGIVQAAWPEASAASSSAADLAQATTAILNAA